MVSLSLKQAKTEDMDVATSLVYEFYRKGVSTPTDQICQLHKPLVVLISMHGNSLFKYTTVLYRNILPIPSNGSVSQEAEPGFSGGEVWTSKGFEYDFILKNPLNMEEKEKEKLLNPKRRISYILTGYGDDDLTPPQDNIIRKVHDFRAAIKNQVVTCEAPHIRYYLWVNLIKQENMQYVQGLQNKLNALDDNIEVHATCDEGAKTDVYSSLFLSGVVRKMLLSNNLLNTKCTEFAQGAFGDNGFLSLWDFSTLQCVAHSTSKRSLEQLCLIYNVVENIPASLSVLRKELIMHEAKSLNSMYLCYNFDDVSILIMPVLVERLALALVLKQGSDPKHTKNRMTYIAICFKQLLMNMSNRPNS